ncbi:39S ribosomal protein L50, mitochondrial-like [Octopus sinensis]|uniref:Large ribosomal subunit protein mL50 n=1 Tax=Octopus sinensis TaxID=2607531 RepID=A0A6P7TQL4_9MOLL|nr:39S ribosomal protein L50, mitochondrial-like [Octopus sinensis]
MLTCRVVNSQLKGLFQCRNVANFTAKTLNESVSGGSKNSKDIERANKAYFPPDNLLEIIKKITTQFGGKNRADFLEIELTNTRDKFEVYFNKKSKILNSLFKELGHVIPNNILSGITRVQHIYDFYSRAVSSRHFLDDLQLANTVPNLSIRTDYVRFDPSTDQFFGGRTAFPGRDTIARSLKFPNGGHKAKHPLYNP